ncbi:MAG: efflux RND transporter periplasmic adaptor subunit [Elusimicrobia bacterium]|nr:efflux RND transporter periplasmic adaptor subunit [Elusimicrobiota bacterium]
MIRARILFSIILVFLAASCRREAAEQSRLDAFPVRISEAGRRDIEETIVLVGSIKAKDEAALFSRAPGKLLKNLLKEGDPVKKGQAVVQVERDEVGVRFEPAPVPSTLDGVVARTYLDEGENVTLQTPVALVVNPTELLARAEVPERFAGRVRLGLDARISVDAYPNRRFRAAVARVSPVVDPATRTTLIEARISDAGNLLRPGMFGELTVVIGRSANALAVPIDALAEGSGAAVPVGSGNTPPSGDGASRIATVFVALEGKARKREVELGARDERFAEVKRGLSPGEKVVTFGLFGLKDGNAVEILPPE